MLLLNFHFFSGRVWSYWPTSPKHLEYYERKMLGRVKTPYLLRVVPISMPDGTKYDISTLEITSDPSLSVNAQSLAHIKAANKSTGICAYPLVMIHGFGGGLAVFVKNFDDLAQNFTKLYAFDSLGFGRSSRPQFPANEYEVENMFVESIEAWRKAMGIEKMVLLGHSFGGYQAAAYALRYPNHIKHLVLADPWGFPICPPNPIPKRIPWWARGVVRVLRHFAPFSALRYSYT